MTTCRLENSIRDKSADAASVVGVSVDIIIEEVRP